MSEKPILFSTTMVERLLDGSKTQTRRVVKPQPEAPRSIYEGDTDTTITPFYSGGNFVGLQWRMTRYGSLCDERTKFCDIERRYDCPYGKAGDVLWVREAWREHHFEDGREPLSQVEYRATCSEALRQLKGWKPSIHMPRSACRLLLLVKAVRVERLNDISEADAVAEGYTSRTEFLTGDWATAQAGNPWVWVIEFERAQ